jgi:hypothetical protein
VASRLRGHRRAPQFRRNVDTELVALLTARSWTVSKPACAATYDVLTLAVEIYLGES